jgi:hypothetical protein
MAGIWNGDQKAGNPQAEDLMEALASLPFRLLFFAGGTFALPTSSPGASRYLS